MKAQVKREATLLAKKEKVADAGGRLVGAAFAFLGEMFPKTETSEKLVSLTEAFQARLMDCMDRDEDESLKMTIRLPDESFIRTMARSLARMAAAGP